MDWMARVGLAGGYSWDWGLRGESFTGGSYWAPRNDEVKALQRGEARVHVLGGRLIVHAPTGLYELDIEKDVILWRVLVTLDADTRNWDPLPDGGGRSRGFGLHDNLFLAPVKPVGAKSFTLLQIDAKSGAVLGASAMPSIGEARFVDSHVFDGLAVLVSENGEAFGVECTSCKGAGGRSSTRAPPNRKVDGVGFRSPELGEKDVSVERSAYVVVSKPLVATMIAADDIVIEPTVSASIALIRDRTIEIKAKWTYGTKYTVRARGQLAKELRGDTPLLAFTVAAAAKAGDASDLASQLRRCRGAALSDETKAMLRLQPDQWCGSLPSRFSGSPATGIRDAKLGVVWSAASEQPASYAAADRSCRARGAGWRLPTVLEALSLLTPAKKDELHVAPPFREIHPDTRQGEPSWSHESRVERTNFYRSWVRWWRTDDDGTQGVLNVGIGAVERVSTSFEPFPPPRFRYRCVRGV
jgi:hypothetical protein